MATQIKRTHPTVSKQLLPNPHHSAHPTAQRTTRKIQQHPLCISNPTTRHEQPSSIYTWAPWKNIQTIPTQQYDRHSHGCRRHRAHPILCTTFLSVSSSPTQTPTLLSNPHRFLYQTRKYVLSQQGFLRNTSFRPISKRRRKNQSWHNRVLSTTTYQHVFHELETVCNHSRRRCFCCC